MAKGYWIAHVDVTDPEGYKGYVAANGKAFAKYGARFLVRGGQFECKEGTTRSAQRGHRIQGLRDSAGLLQSPEYAEAMKRRVNASVADMIIIEGYDGLSRAREGVRVQEQECD